MTTGTMRARSSTRPAAVAPVTPALNVRFKVRGTPIQKGSMSGFAVMRNCKACRAGGRCRNPKCVGGKIPGVAVTDQGDRALKAWQTLVHYEAISARNAAGQRMLKAPGALAITLVFVMPRPAEHWNGHELSKKGLAREFPVVTPDLDKLTRSILDGLTSALIEDDKMVVLARIAEVYHDSPRGWTGVTVTARHMLTLDAWVEHELEFHGVWRPPVRKQIALL